MNSRRSPGRAGVCCCAALVLLFSGWQAGAQQRKRNDDGRGRGAETVRALAGTWRLVSRTVTSESGTPVAAPGLGGTPIGYLTYEPGGRVAVQIMRRDRAAGIDCETSGSTAGENNTQSINGYDAYFGTYTIDEPKHTVTHHVEGALAASDVGKNLVRTFELSGNTLSILVENQSPRGRQRIALTWKRARD